MPFPYLKDAFLDPPPLWIISCISSFKFPAQILLKDNSNLFLINSRKKLESKHLSELPFCAMNFHGASYIYNIPFVLFPIFLKNRSSGWNSKIYCVKVIFWTSSLLPQNSLWQKRFSKYSHLLHIFYCFSWKFYIISHFTYS